MKQLPIYLWHETNLDVIRDVPEDDEAAEDLPNVWNEPGVGYNWNEED
jgi:hypothetical protein